MDPPPRVRAPRGNWFAAAVFAQHLPCKIAHLIHVKAFSLFNSVKLLQPCLNYVHTLFNAPYASSLPISPFPAHQARPNSTGSTLIHDTEENTVKELDGYAAVICYSQPKIKQVIPVSRHVFHFGLPARRCYFGVCVCVEAEPE